MSPKPIAAALVALAGSSVALAQPLFPAVVPLSTLDGSDGFRLPGLAPSDSSGRSVSGAGDVNGDGVDDFLVSAGRASSPGLALNGECYVVFGTPEVGASGVFDFAALDGTNGYRIRGIESNDEAGARVSGAGDINGDGIDDLLIGAYLADSPGLSNNGECYVVFGGTTVGATGVVELAALDGSNGFALTGIDDNDFMGSAISSAGDVNGDQVADFVLTATNAEPNGQSSGEVYVVFGGVGVGSSGSIALSSLDGSNGFIINGEHSNGRAGQSASGAGDVNRDGYDDVIFGSGTSDSVGAAYVVYGGPTVGNGGVIEASSLSGADGFVLNGIDALDGTGISVSGAGDVNGDGFDDVMVGADRGDAGGVYATGETFVVFGAADLGSSGAVALASLDGTNGYVINGAAVGDRSGSRVSGAGDVNADGVDDLLIGAGAADPNGPTSGESYLVFGGPLVGASGSVELSSLDGFSGVTLPGIDANDRSGDALSSAGDINDDGVDDIIIGSGGGNESYVIFGRGSFVWDSVLGGSFDEASNWRAGVVPTGGLVRIATDFGVTVTGPAGALSINELQLIADFGRTELAMAPGSLVEIALPLELPASAAVTGSGLLSVEAGVINNGLIDPTDLTLISSAGVTNNGEMRFESFSRGSAASAMDVFGALDNSASGEIFFRGSATLETTGGLTNDGAVDFTDADATLRGDIVNNAAMSGSATSVIVLTDDLTNDGAFVLAADSSLSILGDLSGNGVTGPGGGMGGAVFIGGMFTPGRAMEAGLAAFGGDVSLAVGSETQIDLASASSFDEITGLGVVNVSGDLTVNLLAGYEPQAGDAFTIVQAMSVNGVFSNVTLPAPPKGSEWDLTYGAAEIVLSLVGGSPADLSGDGCVDSADLAILLAAWNTLSADLNGDGVADSADLAIMLAAWGGGC